ncbi:MAG TPA: hypothetical protein VFV67_08295 [Actinophytocola sp.]|uniref:hypothetical protein n=1 Tax=Actinophytocola sp. TaxID=1872138 RepID=UPI002DBC844F|nr:hypothetical protein [Actinophytocola sp.]HEU5470639.1 hypothetical protein [Actinophytocola sp.]
MPGTDYEVFLPEHGQRVHRVVAVLNDPQQASVVGIATVDDAVRATRLADALNSRLLARRNHTARLAAALAGLPRAVRTTTQRIPIGHLHPEDLLASDLAADPIDGLMLFPRAAQDHPPWQAVTPRLAHLLALAGDLLADLCHDLLIPSGAPPADAPTETGLRDLVHGWIPDRIHHLGTALEGVAAHLRDGLVPAQHTVTDHAALHLIVERARTLPTDRPALLRGRHLLLPVHPGTADAALDTLCELRHVTP